MRNNVYEKVEVLHPPLQFERRALNVRQGVAFTVKPTHRLSSIWLLWLEMARWVAAKAGRSVAILDAGLDCSPLALTVTRPIEE